jgi:hypothetical protein
MLLNGLFINLTSWIHRHVCIVFLSNSAPIPIFILLIRVTDKVTFQKHCYWLVGQKYKYARDGEGPDLN